MVNIGELLDFSSLLKVTETENKLIDVLKMDIEGPEKAFFEYLDMDYACKYFKQLVFETHKDLFHFRDLVKLEKCFLLFRRDTRFFEYMDLHPDLGPLTEFQAPKGFKINVSKFFNESYLAETMFVTGELYFVNENFL
jgi:hypothetical protein